MQATLTRIFFYLSPEHNVADFLKLDVCSVLDGVAVRLHDLFVASSPLLEETRMSLEVIENVQEVELGLKIER